MSAARDARRRPAARRSARRRLRVVASPRRKRLPFVIASFVVVGSLVLSVVTVQALASQGSFRMQVLSRHNAQIAELNGQLQLEIAELSAPARIAKEARQLGFRTAAPDQTHTLVLRPDRSQK